MNEGRLSSLKGGEAILENSFANAEANRIFAEMETDPSSHVLWSKLRGSAGILSRQYGIGSLEHKKLIGGLNKIHSKSGCKEKHK